MLKLLRKKGVAKKVIWAIAIVIIISFGFLGTAYLITGDTGAGYTGKIFGKKVSRDDFNKAYRNARIQAVRQYGFNLRKVAHLLNLEAQAWDQLILLYEAKKRRLKVSNDEIIKHIESDKSFEKNNRFDVLLYNTILRNLQVRPRDYEETVRDNLKIAKLYNQVTSSVVLTEEDVFKEYQNRNEKIQVSYVFVPFETFKDDIVLEEAEIEQYYRDHMSEFLEPPAVNVQYLTFDFPEWEEAAETSETQEAAADDREAQQEKAKDIVREKAGLTFEQLLVNPDMAEIARQNNMGMQTSGYFSREQPNLTLGWPYDLLNRIFDMSLNEISEPFETADGLVVVQIKEKREPYIPEFSEAQDRARKALADEKAKDIARNKTQEHLKSINEELDKSKLRDFPNAAKALELEIHQTPVFNRGQYLPNIGISKEFQEAAFALTEDSELSGVVETAKGYCILHLDNYIPVENSEYEKSREELAQSIAAQKQNEVFGDYLMQLRQEAGLVDYTSRLQDRAQ